MIKSAFQHFRSFLTSIPSEPEQESPLILNHPIDTYSSKCLSMIERYTKMLADTYDKPQEVKDPDILNSLIDSLADAEARYYSELGALFVPEAPWSKERLHEKSTTEIAESIYNKHCQNKPHVFDEGKALIRSIANCDEFSELYAPLSSIQHMWRDSEEKLLAHLENLEANLVIEQKAKIDSYLSTYEALLNKVEAGVQAAKTHEELRGFSKELGKKSLKQNLAANQIELKVAEQHFKERIDAAEKWRREISLEVKNRAGAIRKIPMPKPSLEQRMQALQTEEEERDRKLQEQKQAEQNKDKQRVEESITEIWKVFKRRADFIREAQKAPTESRMKKFGDSLKPGKLNLILQEAGCPSLDAIVTYGKIHNLALKAHGEDLEKLAAIALTNYRLDHSQRGEVKAGVKIR
jgi:hypothetical protein